MSEATMSPSLRDFAERLRETAREIALNVQDRPELTSTVFSGEQAASTTLSPADLPAESLALGIGRYTVLIGLLPDVPTPETVRESLRRYRNQCVVARSYLSAHQSLDLQMILLGPRGSEGQDEWEALALMVERDDRVARKLAWLRPEPPQFDTQSYNVFVKRTFLARPWNKVGEFEDVALDQLSETAAIGEEFLCSTTDEWERIVLDAGDKTPDEIVASLVKAWEMRGKE